MANTQETYWSADDQSLNTYARNVSQITGRTPPSFRGDDIVVPYRDGEVWQPKKADARVITLGMWVRGTDEDGNPGDHRKQFDANWMALLELLWTPRRQFRLTKRFYDRTGTLRSATALAEFAGGLEPAMIGRNAAKFTVDLKLTDPWFYSDVAQVFNLVNGAQNLDILGNVDTTRIKVTANGARTNLKLRNNTPGVEFTHPYTLLTGGVSIIDIQKYTALVTPSGGATIETDGIVTHAGAIDWLYLQKGINNLTMSSTSGAGAVVLEARGAWV